MRIKAFILSIIMIFSMLPLQMMAVHAAGDEIVLEDDFSSNIGNWTDMLNASPQSARYSVTNGIMNITTDPRDYGNRIYVKNAVDFGTSDYELSFRLRLNSWTEYTYVLFRAESLEKCYGLWYNAYGYEKAVSIVKNNTTQIMPGHAKNAADAGFKTVGWNDIKIKLQGNHIQVYINNMNVPTFDIIDEENPNLTGGIAFGLHTGQKLATGFSIDDVKVTIAGNQDTSVFGDFDAPEDVAGTNYEDAAKLLMDLHIMDSYEKEDNFKEQASVTRGEFAKIMVSALNMNPVDAPEDDVTVDVSADYEYAQYVLTALQNGILSLSSDGKFNPEQPVKYEEAVKCIVHTMGYEELANYYGGYPDGYISVAIKIKLLKGINSQKGYAITKGHLAQLIYNALHSDILKIVGIKGDSIIYGKGAKTWLNNYFNIYEDSGIVEATPHMAIKSASLTDEGMVCIDNYIFKVGNSDVEDYIGAEVDYYYYETDNNRYIVSAILANDSVLEINSSDLIDYNNHTYSYYDGNKTRKATVSSMADFFYNGRSMGTNEYYKPKSGKVRLVDTDKNRIYDVVMVTSYTVTVYNGYNAVDNMILDKYDASYNIPLEIEVGELSYKIRNQKGKELEPDKITMGSILNVAVSADGKLVSIEASTDKVNGVVDSVSDDTVIINDTEYRKSSVIRNAEVLAPGKKVELMLDYMGEIAYVSTNENGSFSYIIAKAKVVNGLESSIKIRYVSSVSGNVEVASCNKKVIIDGTRYSDLDSIYSKITTESAAIVKLVSGNIAEIDYPYIDSPKSGEYDTSLKYLGGGKSSHVYFFNMMFGNKLSVTNNTIMIEVPREDAASFDNEKLFKVSSPNRLPTLKYYDMEGFSTENSLSAQYLVRYVSSADVDAGTPTMLDNWGLVLDEEGNACTYIEGYNQTGKSYYVMPYDATESHADIINKFERGMLLNIKLDSNGDARVIEVLYEKDTDKVISEWYDGDGAYNREFYKAKLSDVDDNCMIYLRENADGTSYERIAKHTSVKVYIMSKSDDEIYASSMKDLRSIERDGYDNADDIFVHQAQLLPRVIFVQRP